MKKSVLLCFFTLFSLFCSAKDMFRVHETILVEMTDEVSSHKTRLTVNDMLAVKLPDNPLFLRGLSLEIKIPKSVTEYRDAVAFSIYTDMQPEPSQNTIDYSGNKLHLDTFPGKLSYNLQIPLIHNHGLKETPYSALLPYIVDIAEGYVYFRLQLVMKGTPVSVLEAVFDIEVKPIIIDKGLLDLSMQYPDPAASQKIPALKAGEAEPTVPDTPVLEKKDYTVFIDEKQAQLNNGKILLSSGIHHIAVVSDFYRSEVRTVKVEQGYVSKVQIQLHDNDPLLYVSIPKSVSLFFNDIQLIDFEKPYKITEGEHVLKFMLDDYEIVKVIQAFKGRNYTASLLFDVIIREE